MLFHALQPGADGQRRWASSNPVVTLNNLNFPAVPGASSGTQIVANFPAGMPPSSFTPGTYFLTIQYRNQLPSLFSVNIGAAGSIGAQGPQGPAGPTDAAGTSGPLASLSALDGIPCSVGATAGTTILSFGASSAAVITCQLPQPPPPDGINNTATAPDDLRSIGCGLIGIETVSVALNTVVDFWMALDFTCQTAGDTGNITYVADHGLTLDIDVPGLFFPTVLLANHPSDDTLAPFNIFGPAKYLFHVHGTATRTHEVQFAFGD